MELKKGDTIGIIALSGACDRIKTEKAQAYFENLGYKVRLSKNIYDKTRYLAGNDEDKINELHDFFHNPDIKLIICARGGYGGIRLINKINYDLIKANPKPFCGFSDVTSLLLMIYKKTGLITYHSPMACTDFAEGKENIDKFTEENFFKAISGELLSFKGTTVYKDGAAEGVLFGGNLATVVTLCGQDFLPDKDFLFFAEDLNEPVYKIDRMFQQLLNIEKFIRYCKGIILGDFLDVDNNNWLTEYFYELSNKLSVPVIGGFKISHAKEKITLPIGKNAHLNGLGLIIP